MKKLLLPLVTAGFLLSGCAVYVEGGPHTYARHHETSLTERADTDAPMTVSCAGEREPYSKGGENGEPLVMGCRDPQGAGYR